MRNTIFCLVSAAVLGTLVAAAEADGAAKCPVQTKTVAVYVEGYGRTPQAARRAARAHLKKDVAANEASLRRWAARQGCNSYCRHKHAGGVRAEKVKEGVKPSGIRMKAGLARSKGPLYSARHKAYVDGYSQDVVVTVTCTRP